MPRFENVTGAPSGRVYLSLINSLDLGSTLVNSDLSRRTSKFDSNKLASIANVIVARKLQPTSTTELSVMIDKVISAAGGAVPAPLLKAIETVPLNGQCVVQTLRVQASLFKADEDIIYDYVDKGLFLLDLQALLQFASANGIALTAITFGSFTSPSTFAVLHLGENEDVNKVVTIPVDVNCKGMPAVTVMDTITPCASDFVTHVPAMDLTVKTQAFASGIIYPLVLITSADTAQHYCIWGDAIFSTRVRVRWDDDYDQSLLVAESITFILRMVDKAVVPPPSGVRGHVHTERVDLPTGYVFAGNPVQPASQVEHPVVYQDPGPLDRPVPPKLPSLKGGAQGRGRGQQNASFGGNFPSPTRSAGGRGRGRRNSAISFSLNNHQIAVLRSILQELETE